MKLINVVKKARKEGIKITYRRRMDGGIIIKSINGRKYEGAKGNTALRFLTGQRLRPVSIIQRRKIGFKEKRPEEFTLKNLFRKAQREWKKANIIIKGTASRLTKQGFETSLQTFGEEETRAKLVENIQYSRGIAYDTNVEFWSEKILDSKAEFNDTSFEVDKKTGLSLEDRLDNISNYLKDNLGNISEETLKEIHDLYYDHQNGLISDEEYVEQMEALLF